MKISVALCTYNGSKFLSKQLESILNQLNFNVDEIVVCDDRSTDDTIKILNDFQSKYPSVFKIYSNEQNLGSTKNFEKAISLCTGDFIFLADQDDIWKENKIKETFSVFEANKKAEGVFSNADIIDDNDILAGSTSIWDSVFFFESELQKPIDFFDVIAKNQNIVTGATLCFKKEVKEFIFPFPSDVLHDEWIATLLALRNTLFYSPKDLISYRVHANQQVGMKNRNKLAKKNKKKKIVLNIENPITFSDYRFLYKRTFAKLKKVYSFKNSDILKIYRPNLVSETQHEWSEINSLLESKFPIQHTISKTIDQVRGKRKMNF